MWFRLFAGGAGLSMGVAMNTYAMAPEIISILNDYDAMMRSAHKPYSFETLSRAAIIGYVFLAETVRLRCLSRSDYGDLAYRRFMVVDPLMQRKSQIVTLW